MDVVIGTHRLLQPSIRYRDLGLVVVDDEQRFGVEHKEHITALRAHVDMLTMSATPLLFPESGQRRVARSHPHRHQKVRTPFSFRKAPSSLTRGSPSTIVVAPMTRSNGSRLIHSSPQPATHAPS